jgi:hypothetical protein
MDLSQDRQLRVESMLYIHCTWVGTVISKGIST